MLWSNRRMSSVVKGISAAGTGRPRRQSRALAAAVLEALETRRLLTAFSYTGSIQTYSVPTTGIYDISIAGAQGGASNDTSQHVSSDAEAGGLGAVIGGDVSLTAGTVLQVVVGGQGTTSTGADAGGGGGGSFVFVSGAPQPIVVAGGGGGAAFQYATTGADAQTSENGSTPQNSDQPGTGGTNGSGGTGGGVADYGGAGGGGAGWSGNGGDATNDAGAGGFDAPTFAGGPVAQSGGFGGGGGGSVNGGGGGGGYSGGGGGAYSFGIGINGFIGGGGGGGGGSYTADLTSLTSAVTQTGNGYFDITPLATPTITSAAQPASAAVGNTIADKATVSGGASPTGTVTFNLYNNATATGPVLFTDTETLSGGTATSASYTPIATGTDYWVATYNGDSNNAPVSTVDNAGPVTVTGSLVVTSTSDSSSATGNTLREAIAYANTLTGPQTVTFASALTAGGPATITLTGSELDITGSLTITGPGANELTIDDNGGAGIFQDSSQTAGATDVSITGLTLTDSDDGNYGVIYNTQDLTLAGDVIGNNFGMGVYNAGTLDSSGDTFVGNSNTDQAGGAIENNGTFNSSNDTFSGNSAGAGGAIFNGGTAKLANDTITANTVENPSGTTGYAGGIYNGGGTVTLANTIIAANTDTQNDPDVFGAFDSLGHNLIGDGAGGTGFVASDQVGTSASPINPLLGTLASNGGPTPTIAELTGSPAINAGSNALAVDSNGNALTTDQRGPGYPRIVDGTVDIGAFELQITTAKIVGTPLPSMAVVGTAVADKATVTGNNPGGTVTFNLYNNAQANGPSLFTDTEMLSGGTATSNPVVPIQTGTYYWVATYNGDENNSGVSTPDAAQPVTITPATPSISNAPQPGTATVGQTIADQATVSGGYNPTGTVTFNLYNNATAKGPALFTDTENLSAGTATSANYTTTAPGTDYWVATYNPDNGNNISVHTDPAGAPVTISAIDTKVSVISNPNPSVFGQQVTFTATVTPLSGNASPTGAVQFYVGNIAYGSPVAVSAGQASITDSALPVGRQTIAATYTSNSADFIGNSNSTTQVVNADGTSTSLSSNHNPSVPGQQVTFTATVSANAPGSGTPAGQVQFYIDGKAYGSPVALNNGQAQISDAALSVGHHSITATFTSGNTDFTGGSSSIFTQIVNKATTTFSNLSAPTIIVNTLTVTLHGTITGNGSPAPTGSVTITISHSSGPYAGQVVGVTTARIGAGGMFSASVFSFFDAVGTYSITYSYAGDADNLGVSASTTAMVTYGVSTPLGGFSVMHGSTFPVEVILTDDSGYDISNTGVNLTATGIAPAATPNAIQPIPTGSSAFTYRGGIYRLNLKTTGLSAGKYILYFTAAGDPVVHSLTFVLT